MASYSGMPYDELDDNNMSDIDICTEAFQNRSAWENYYAKPIQTARQNKNFIYNDSWDSQSRAKRTMKGKLCLETNLIRPAQRELIAEQRAVDPQIMIIPTDASIPTKIVETKSGLFRHICYKSNAKLVWSQSYRDQIDCGYGAFVIKSVPANNGTCQKELQFGAINDVLQCFWDVGAKTTFKTDGNCAGMTFSMNKKEFHARYPKQEIPTDNISNQMTAISYNDDNVELMLYYKRHYKKIRVKILEDGTQLSQSQYEELSKQNELELQQEESRYHLFRLMLAQKGVPSEKIPPFQSRVKPLPKLKRDKTTSESYICAYVLSRYEVLEREDLPVDELPLVYVNGDSVILDGCENPLPYSIDAQAPQQLTNYLISEIADSVNDRFRPKFMGTKVHFSDNPDQWNNPDLSVTLTYTPDPRAPNSSPQQFMGSSVDPNLLSLYQEAKQDVMSVLAVRQELSPDASGTAMLVNEMGAANQKGTYPDNLNLAIAHGAKILLKWMPSVYDTERTITTRSQDGKLDYVTINKTIYELDEKNELRIENDMNLGEFTVDVYGGASFAAQRIMGVNFLNNLTQLDVEKMLPLTCDIIAEATPFIFSNKLANRLKQVVVPPQIIAEEEGKPAPQQKPNPVEELEKEKLMIEKIKLILKRDEIKAGIIEELVKAVTTMQKTQAENIESLAEIDAKQIEFAGGTIDKFEEGIAKEIERQQKTIDEIGDKIGQK